MKKFFATICVLIMLAVFPITLVGTIIKTAVLQPAVVKKIIRASQVGELLPTLVADTLSEREAAEGDGGIPNEQIQDIVQSSFPTERVYQTTDGAVDAVAVWLSTNQPIEAIDYAVDLRDIKTQLLSTVEETELMETDLLPDELSVQDMLQTDSVSPTLLKQYNNVIDQARSTIRSLFSFIWIGWGIMAFCILTILLLRHRPITALLAWYGWAIALLALEIVPMVLIVWLAPNWILPLVSQSTSTVIIEVINNALGAFMWVLLTPLLWVLGSMSVTSLVLFILRYSLNRKH